MTAEGVLAGSFAATPQRLEGLPPHHVPRRRLTDRCRDERLVVVEAGAGYGKSVFARELALAWGLVPVEVVLESGGVSAPLLASRLRAAVAAAGFSDAAAAMASAADDPAGVVDAMVTALKGESCEIVIDDAHNALPDAATLIDRIAARMGAGHRLVVLARRLPQGAARLRRGDALQLGVADLALVPDETVELCRRGFGLDVSRADCKALDAATAGWTAAAVLAASRAKRTGKPLQQFLDAGDGEAAGSPVASMLDELVASIGPEGKALARMAPLPLLDRTVVAAATGQADFFDRAMELGLPLTPGRGSWWELPGPVRDHLATLGAPDRGALVEVAACYEGRGELGSALQMLLAAGETDAAAALLASAEPRRIESVDALELIAVTGQIPDEVLGRHPRALFYVARACGVGSLLQPRARLLARLDASVTERDDPVLRRAIDAERAIEMGNGNSPLDAISVASRVLAQASATEGFTRARALNALGQATCFRRDADGALSEETLAEAAGYLDQSMSIFRSLGSMGLVGPGIERAIRTELWRGRPQFALEVLDDLLSYVASSPRRAGRVLFYRAQVLTELGRFDESEAQLDEVLRLARNDTGGLLIAYVHWEQMMLASLRGDADVTLDHANQVEANRGDWWSAGGTHFMAEAADCLDRVGCTAEASRYLERAKAAEPSGSERIVAMSECALLARHGDPNLAIERLAVVHQHGIYPRERWRIMLLRAYACWRLGDAAAGALAAQAFEEAARIGQPQAPVIRERELTASVLALAAETGSNAANALRIAAQPVALTVLGKFELSRGGRPVVLGPGQAAQVVKMVAIATGRVQAEQVIEALWPEVEPSVGRNRLRTVLARLKEVAPEAMRRDGDLLALADDVRVDLAQFYDEARQALALSRGDAAAAVALARSAISRYRGDLLADDPYESWAEEPRANARRTLLDLLDLCARAAALRGDLDEARRMVERALAIAPFEEDHYLEVARIFSDEGRRGAALSVVRRARDVLAPLGIDVPLELPGKVAAA
jgi:ATP/maltotriose-dependent transcriptional regulator MalT